MEFEFSDHAKEQLKRRKITKKIVLKTVKTGKHGTSYKDRKIFQQNIGNKTLEVVTILEKNKLIVITAYYIYENKLRS